jgi:hypothetical protein
VKPTRTKKDIIKVDFKIIGGRGHNLDLGEESSDPCESGNVPSGSIRCREFLHWLSTC